VTTVSPPAPEVLPSELKIELWKHVDRRLRHGEVLITTEQFYRSMIRDFKKLIRTDPSKEMKLELIKMIEAVNEAKPETFLTFGIKNAVTRYLRDIEDRTRGQEGAVDEARDMIKQMIQEGRTALFLEGMGVDVGATGVSARLERAIISVVEGKKLKGASGRDRRQQRRRKAQSDMASVHTSAASQAAEPSEKAAYEPPPSEEEQQARIQEDKKQFELSAQGEIDRAPRNIEAYLQDKKLTEEETTDLRTLYNIDERLAKGEIDEEEANRLRAEISDSVREKLQQRIREAVDHAVHYLNVFEALKRVPPDRDDAFKFLIESKVQVSSEDEDIDLSRVTEALEDDDELVDNLGTLMERKDHEIRMLAANMPPYRHIHSVGEKIGTWIIEDSFVDDLRAIEREELSDRLNSEDGEVRLNTAAGLKCMVALLSLLMRNSPFHREVRRLRIMVRIRRTYNGAADDRDGCNKVQQFLRRRLMNLYPDLTREEKAEIEASGTAFLDEMAGRGGPEEVEDASKRVYRA
jgi:hypothetical protein